MAQAGRVTFWQRMVRGLLVRILATTSVCNGLHFENHVPVFERHFWVAEFFNKMGGKREFAASASAPRSHRGSGHSVKPIQSDRR